MFGRVLTLHVRLEKRPELDCQMVKEVIPIIKRSAGLIEILVLQDEVDLDKLLIISFWKTREDADRYHARFFDKVKAMMEPYVTFPPAMRMYKVEDGVPWIPQEATFHPDAVSEPKASPSKFNVWRWPAS